jgi:hypothetical protein
LGYYFSLLELYYVRMDELYTHQHSSAAREKLWGAKEDHDPLKNRRKKKKANRNL